MSKSICSECVNNYGCKGKGRVIEVDTYNNTTRCDGFNNGIDKIELTKTMRHMEICKELNSLYKSKNNDYGDSFAKVRNDLGKVTIMVRVCDKVERLKTLILGTEQKVKDESIEDSFRDLANYCLMELVERAVDKDGNK